MSTFTAHRTNPLTNDQISEFFSSHLPYRLSMLNSFKIIPWNELLANSHISKSMVKNFKICCCEASRISCRMFIEFMGLGINSKRELVEKKVIYCQERIINPMR